MNCTIVCNPNAGRFRDRSALDAAVVILERHGWRVDLCFTDHAGHAQQITESAAKHGSEAVLAAGGDGTVNEVLQGLVHTDTALGCIPLGTVNVWARELGIPFSPEGAALAFAEGRRELIDLGRANDRYFLLMTGIGFDGEVVRRAQIFERYKRRFGVLPYVIAGLTIAPRYRGRDYELRYDGVIRRVQALMLVVGNTRLYGGYFRLTADAVSNDGWLDLCLLKGRGFAALTRQSLPLLLTRSVRFSDVEVLRVRELTVHSELPSRFQLDGELSGITPIKFSVAPKSLTVIVPANFNSSLIS